MVQFYANIKLTMFLFISCDVYWNSVHRHRMVYMHKCRCVSAFVSSHFSFYVCAHTSHFHPFPFVDTTASHSSFAIRACTQINLSAFLTAPPLSLSLSLVYRCHSMYDNCTIKKRPRGKKAMRRRFWHDWFMLYRHMLYIKLHAMRTVLQIDT